MMTDLQRVGSWLNHLVKARSRHGVHSPFVYDLSDRVLRAQDEPAVFGTIEVLREELLDSDQTIRVNDLGAGSRALTNNARAVSDIASTALKPERQAQLLYRLARHFAPSNIVELGTSFGISTLYLANGAPDAEVHTIEGCPRTLRIAQHNIDRLKQRNVHAHLGSFKGRLPEVLKRVDAVDMAYIDGHHAKEPTLEYFGMLMNKAHEGTVFIFDDIHWSRGMEEAWESVKADDRIHVTIDLFDMGLAFVRSEQAPQHFRLRY
ncbi:MAG: class I SAM-dependent methyltransferase [Flavobacteriales bacterium]|nr:MAG: class I SAM-dependent methyltransferase [Flavobacteriales bacterium]